MQRQVEVGVGTIGVSGSSASKVTTSRYSPKTRPGGSRQTSPSCRSNCEGGKRLPAALQP